MKLWTGDWRIVFMANIVKAGESLFFFTLTPPGAGVLGWDRSRCRHPRHLPCSGKKHGCVVDPVAAHLWNQDAPANWSKLNKAAGNRVRRKVGSHRLVAVVWELQKRGVLHRHGALRATSAVERKAARLYVEALRELAPSYGFGFVDMKDSARSVLHAARYMAKYLGKSDSPGKQGLAEVAAHIDCPPRPAWVDPQLIRRTGESMRSCRERRVVWNLATRLAPMHPDGCSLGEARQVRGRRIPPRRGPPGLRPCAPLTWEEALEERRRHRVPPIGQMYEDRLHLDRLCWAAERLFPGAEISY